MKEIIRKIDILGYPVSLNFDKKGQNFKTINGGIFSLIYFGFILFYGILGILKIKFHLQDTNLSYTNNLNLGDLGPVNFNSTNFKYFFWFLKGNENLNIPYENLTEYLDLYIE